jgi:UV DNA damage endonuclease
MHDQNPRNAVQLLIRFQACLNTYLRTSNPPVFNSRTCRIASILEHRHPLRDPSLPEHPIKNRPDREKPSDAALGQRWVENLGLANARDIIKIIRWNDRYGIKFLRLSSEMFPFASHEEYGYSLAPFASEALAAAGKVIADLGHRVSTHPGQFTQLGSPRSSVVEASIRDLVYHDELLTLLKLPEQQDRDAVMILHMGGVFGSKPETFERFRANYARLSDSVKRRLVLENDDMSYSVHDLLPICRELDIPLVLDFHHHNIIFDSSAVREGTTDLIPLYPQISETWRRKGITQKMHYSEATSSAMTRKQRRKHSARVASLPPCAADMDLMIEAKDKEQAVFELMRNFRLPGFESFTDIIPHVRHDENKVIAAGRKKKAAGDGETKVPVVPEDEIGMGGPKGRVYWPPGMEDWLRPKKRVLKAKEGPAEIEIPTKIEAGDDVPITEEPTVKVSKRIKTESIEAVAMPIIKKPKSARKNRAMPRASNNSAKDYLDDEDDEDEKVLESVLAQTKSSTRRASNRGQRKSYAEVDVSD